MKTPGLNPIQETTRPAPEGTPKETTTRRPTMRDPPAALPRPVLAAPLHDRRRLRWPARIPCRAHHLALLRFNGSTPSRFTGFVRAFASLRLCVNSAIPVLKPRLLHVALLALALGLLPGMQAPCVHAQELPTYYVNVANANPVFPYTSWATAATIIPDAVNAGRTTGRLVLVTNGVYQTGTVEANGANRVALTNVVLRTVNGPEVTIIDEAGAARCAYLGTNAILSGFTLRNGWAGEDCWGGWGGGVRCEASSVLTNSVLTGNSASVGGGGASGRGKPYNCALTGNSAESGGGASEGTLHNCIVYLNQGGNRRGATFQHSCTTPLPPGPGNIAANPQLASDTHLSVTSPCLGAGSSEWASGVDIDGERWANPPAMGADQVWSGASIGALKPIRAS